MVKEDPSLKKQAIADPSLGLDGECKSLSDQASRQNICTEEDCLLA